MQADPLIDDIFFPALRGLPEASATTLAILPIHDANALLIQAICAAGRWPAHAYACVVGSDPFRPMEVFLGSLRALHVQRICCFPLAALHDEPTNRMLDASDIGLRAEQRFDALARRMGFEVLSVPSSAIGR